MDDLDRQIINRLQSGLPVCERPWLAVADDLGVGEQDVLARLQAMLDDGRLSRVGPMYNAERMGGAVTLAAMQVPDEDFERVAAQVNTFPEVAHNYARAHAFNLWFVLATETPEEIPAVIRRIEAATGLPVHDMPKEREFFIGLRFEA